jgi:hypothetical protein
MNDYDLETQSLVGSEFRVHETLCRLAYDLHRGRDWIVMIHRDPWRNPKRRAVGRIADRIW